MCIVSKTSIHGHQEFNYLTLYKVQDQILDMEQIISIPKIIHDIHAFIDNQSPFMDIQTLTHGYPEAKMQYFNIKRWVTQTMNFVKKYL